MPLTPEERRLQIINAMKNAPLTTTTDPSLTTAPTMRPTVPTTSADAALAAPPPIPSEGVNPSRVVPPVRITYGPKGLSGVDALMAQRGAMQENPYSKVSMNEQGQAEIAPPKPERHGFKGTLKNIGEGVLSGLALADPDNPNAILGSAIGGGVTAGVNRSAGPQLHHRFDMNVMDNDIARGLKLEQGQTQLSGLKEEVRQRAGAPTDAEVAAEATRINNEKLRVEEMRIQGAIKDQDADREQKRLDREAANLRNQTTAAATVESARIRSGNRGGLSPDKIAENQAKREAKINESSALYKKADNLEAEAKKMEDEMAAGTRKDPYGDVAKTVTQYREEARQRRVEGDKARAEGESIPEQQATPSTTGTTKGRDGKYHYTMAQIQATIDPKTGKTAKGQRLEEVINALKQNPNVVVDQ